MRLVLDASTIIGLARIGMLDLLQSAADELFLPAAAYDEILRHGPDRPGAREVAGASWLRMGRVVDQWHVTRLRERLGHGESEAIVLALEVGADALVLDDALARQVAESEGRPVVGLLGLLIHAKQQGRIPALRRSPKGDRIPEAAGVRDPQPHPLIFDPRHGRTCKVRGKPPPHERETLDPSDRESE